MKMPKSIRLIVWLFLQIRAHADSPRVELRVEMAHTGAVTSVAFSPDQKQVITGGADGAVRLWDVNTGKEIRTFSAPPFINSVAVSPDGHWLLTGGASNFLWDIRTGAKIRMFGRGGTSVAFSPNGRLVVVAGGGEGSSPGTIDLWETTGKEIRRFEGHSHVVSSVEFSRTGSQMLTGGFDDTVRLWDLASGREIRRFVTHQSTVARLSPDGRHILSGGDGGIVRLWDIDTGLEVRSFKGPWKVIWSIQFLSRGTEAVIAGDEWGGMILWDANSGKQIRKFDDGSRQIQSVSVDARGEEILSGEDVGTAVLWSKATARSPSEK